MRFVDRMELLNISLLGTFSNIYYKELHKTNFILLHFILHRDYLSFFCLPCLSVLMKENFLWEFVWWQSIAFENFPLGIFNSLLLLLGILVSCFYCLTCVTTSFFVLKCAWITSFTIHFIFNTVRILVLLWISYLFAVLIMFVIFYFKT